MNIVFVQVNPELKSHFEEKGFCFVGQDVEGERMEVIELDGMEAEAFCLYRCLLSGFLKVKKLQPSDHFFQNLKCPFQTIHISSECSTTPSSPLAPSSHHLLILDCYWPLLGSCRATYRRAAVCLHGKQCITCRNSHDLPMYRLSFSQTTLLKVCLCHRDTYSDQSGSSTPDSEISELKLPSISNE